MVYNFLSAKVPTTNTTAELFLYNVCMEASCHVRAESRVYLSSFSHSVSRWHWAGQTRSFAGNRNKNDARARSEKVVMEKWQANGGLLL